MAFCHGGHRGGVRLQHETFKNTNHIAEYTYNGAGQRIKKVAQTETKIFHYDPRGHLIAETNQTGQMLAEYIYLGDQLLSMIKPEKRFIIITTIISEPRRFLQMIHKRLPGKLPTHPLVRQSLQFRQLRIRSAFRGNIMTKRRDSITTTSATTIRRQEDISLPIQSGWRGELTCLHIQIIR